MEHLEPDALTFVYDHIRAGRDDRRLRRDRELERVRRGAYIERGLDSALSEDLRYDLRIHAVLGTRRSPVVVSHQSAARLWGMPLIEGWPWHVHITVPPNSPRRTKNGVIVHRAPLSGEDVVELDGVLLTSPARTILDIARTCTFVNGVGVADHALRVGLALVDDLARRVEDLGVARGSAQTRRVVEFASPLAETAGESFSRAVMYEHHYPTPVLQHELTLPSGRRRRLDFYWPDLLLGGEFDGRLKYATDPEEAHWQEKLRANEVFDAGVTLVRWGWLDVAQRTPFLRRLDAAGLVARRPRGYSARSGRQ